MSLSRLALALFVVIGGHAALAASGLTYRVRFRPEPGAAPVEARLRVDVTNPAPRRGRAARPRWGSWRVVVTEAPGALAPGLLRARLEQLLFLVPPRAGSRPTGRLLPVGRHRYPAWSLLGGTTAELLEVRPGLLALYRLEGDFPEQGLTELSLVLEAIRGGRSMAPPQSGDRLADTLVRRRILEPLRPLAPEGVE